MHPDQERWIRLSKRLNQAEGYLELNMPQAALRVLEGIDPGPWEAPVAMFRGRILLALGDYAAAAASFHTAAEKSQAPNDRFAWGALSHCYRLAGDSTRAVQMLGRARGAFAKPYQFDQGDVSSRS